MLGNRHRKIPDINITHKKYIKDIKRLSKKQIVLRVILWVLLVIVLYELSFLIINPKYKRTEQGLTAVWMEHTWAGEEHATGIIRMMSQNLKYQKVSDAYFHVGPLDGNGKVELNKFESARALVAEIKKQYPEIRLHAWLSQITINDDGALDLTDENTRKNLADTTGYFLDLGFDGVHLDLEPVYSDDVYYLDMLSRAKVQTKERNKELSVSAMRPAPINIMEWYHRIFSKYPGYWSKDYFIKVSETVDHMSIFTFDSRMITPASYGRLVKWITKWCGKNVSCRVFIGITTNDRMTRSHIPFVENEKIGVKGYKLGIKNLDDNKKNNIGLAVYGEWTTDRFEWRSINSIYEIEENYTKSD